MTLLKLPLRATMLMVILAAPAFAHTGQRGHVMLLPTHLYILGGAIAVAVSFAVLAFVAPGRHAGRGHEINCAPPRWLCHIPSLASLALLTLLIAAGFLGPPDPLSNPLPGFIWAQWWVGFTFLCVVLGNLWPLVNPCSGLLALIQVRPLLAYPPWLGQWPAVLTFAVFAWFELVHPAPQDPRILATAVTAYAVFTFAGIGVFGQRDWLSSAEAFSVFFRMIGGLSPLQWQPGGLRVAWPGSGLLNFPVADFSAMAFILLSLSAVSFDGLSRTFAWAGLIDVNPLEYPGRSAVLTANTLGLAGSFLALSSAYCIAAALGRLPLRPFAVSLIPIAVGYHLAHYLPTFPADAMHALKALSDPFGTGLDLLGTAAIAPPVSFFAGSAASTLLFQIQTALIVAAHVIAVLTARRLAGPGGAMREMPLTLLMVAYTMFGLWLLSAPVIG